MNSRSTCCGSLTEQLLKHRAVYRDDVIDRHFRAAPVVYLVSGFRWSFYGSADVAVGVSLAMTLLFLAVFVGVATWMLRTGYRLKP